ncbi:hypothetical protein GOBAR_DD32521 [Gossypium barbadense]|nr:hypothetical protein GOBAR_DD32521 [Gossypium barbadense]
MSQSKVTMEVGNDGIAVITISNPLEKFAEPTRQNNVKAIVLTCKGGRFSNGFDIKVFTKVHGTGIFGLLSDIIEKYDRWVILCVR